MSDPGGDLLNSELKTFLESSAFESKGSLQNSRGREFFSQRAVAFAIVSLQVSLDGENTFPTPPFFRALASLGLVSLQRAVCFCESMSTVSNSSK